MTIPFYDAVAARKRYYTVHAYQLRNLARHVAKRAKMCPWCKQPEPVTCWPCWIEGSRNYE